MGRLGTYSKAEHGNPAEMGKHSSSGHALIGMASAVAQDGQAAGRDGRKGRAGPAHMGGPFMAFMYRFFRTFCVHVLAVTCLQRVPGASVGRMEAYVAYGQ